MAVPDETDFGVLASQITAWLRDRVTEAGATRLVLGLSGGVDSAVVCALAARAFGPGNVIAAIMPIHSPAQDLEDAEIVARAFDVSPITLDLVPAYQAIFAAIPGSGVPKDAGNQLARSNVKPRIRMTALYYLAQSHGGLVVGTGNRIELGIGYFTKYGDGGVDLLPIGDLSKSEVRAMALELGVPASVIAKPPSAGLWYGQTDEADIGLTYDQLDCTLRAIASPTPGEVDQAFVARVQELVSRSAHKRQPIPMFVREPGED